MIRAGLRPKILVEPRMWLEGTGERVAGRGHGHKILLKHVSSPQIGIPIEGLIHHVHNDLG